MRRSLFVFVLTCVALALSKISQIAEFDAVTGKNWWSVQDRCLFVSLSFVKSKKSSNALSAYMTVLFFVACAHFCVPRIETASYALLALMLIFFAVQCSKSSFLSRRVERFLAASFAIGGVHG